MGLVLGFGGLGAGAGEYPATGPCLTRSVSSLARSVASLTRSVLSHARTVF